MMVPRREHPERGFTLLEVLTVVIIIGILATLAGYGVRKYLFAAKTSEAVSMITSIKAAEEAYRDETFVYLDVSGDYDSLYPMTVPGQTKVMWGGNGNNADRWRALGMQSDAPVQFGYAVVARQANQPLPEPIPGKSLGFVASNDPSYCVVAKGDVDGDGTFQYVVGHSFNSELHIENEGE